MAASLWQKEKLAYCAIHCYNKQELKIKTWGVHANGLRVS